jgi:TolA-binding protein
VTESAVSPKGAPVVPIAPAGKKTESVQQMEMEVKEFETSFCKLFVEVGANSVDEIISLYNNQEQMIDETFAEANFQQSQITQLTSEVRDLDQELKKYKRMRLDLKQKQRLEKIEQRKKTSSAKDAVDLLIADNKRELKLIKVLISLSDEPFQEQLSQIQTVLDINLFDEDTNEWNLSSYSKEIEGKVNNLLTIHTSLAQSFHLIKVEYD